MWQTLVGAWPLPRDRARAYARQGGARGPAAHVVARARTRRTRRRSRAGVDGVLADRGLRRRARAVRRARSRPRGDRNSLAQLLVKLTAPGVPDFYQGSELRDD